MRRSSVLAGLVLSTWLMATGSEVFAQGFFVTITVDENAHGTFTNSNGFVAPLPVALLADPGPGGLPFALTYSLLNPPGLVAGDLLLLEPGGTGMLSDLIRFNPGQFGGALVFYSSNTGGSHSPADMGFPAALYPNNFSAFETGPEGNRGFTYTPTAGQPGFVAGADGPVTYVIQDETHAVPEPSSVVLLGLGLAGLSAWGWKRRFARQA